MEFSDPDDTHYRQASAELASAGVTSSLPPAPDDVDLAAGGQPLSSPAACAGRMYRWILPGVQARGVHLAGLFRSDQRPGAQVEAREVV